jgi:putative nucleotidyltransferase-like protein
MVGRPFGDLAALAGCLTGRPPETVDWDAIIALANQTLTITDLAAALVASVAQGIPDDVRSYLSVILVRNVERNGRLLAQLEEAAACLGARGIEVALMKGSAILVAERETAPGRRLLLDLDLVVRPQRMFAAIAALQDIGYEITLGSEEGSWPGSPSHHLPAVLARSRDAGSIDLQCRPKGPASFSDVGWLFAESREARLGGAPVYLPSAKAQIAYLLLHDQFQDGDYWRGLIDLRHLHDIARLLRVEGAGSVDEIRGMFDPGYPRHAVDTQLLTLQALFGGALGPGKSASSGLRSSAQLWRRSLQARHRWLATPLTALTLLSEIFDYPAWDRYGGEPHEGRGREARRRMRELRRIFRPRTIGKA